MAPIQGCTSKTTCGDVRSSALDPFDHRLLSTQVAIRRFARQERAAAVRITRKLPQALLGLRGHSDGHGCRCRRYRARLPTFTQTSTCGSSTRGCVVVYDNDICDRGLTETLQKYPQRDRPSASPSPPCLIKPGSSPDSIGLKCVSVILKPILVRSLPAPGHRDTGR